MRESSQRAPVSSTPWRGARPQLGDWYGLSHRAGSVALEAGHRWTRAAWRPWLRAGYLWASGDDDWRDDRHTTFFQMLPSSRRYALSSAYAQMNIRDVFAQAMIEPRRFNARIEIHRLSLAKRRRSLVSGQRRHGERRPVLRLRRPVRGRRDVVRHACSKAPSTCRSRNTGP